MDIVSLTSWTGKGPARAGRMNDASTKITVPRMMVFVTDDYLVKSISCGNGGIKQQYGGARVHLEDVLTGCCKEDNTLGGRCRCIYPSLSEHHDDISDSPTRRVHLHFLVTGASTRGNSHPDNRLQSHRRDPRCMAPQAQCAHHTELCNDWEKDRRA
jgi:hypothetical protein